MFSRNTQNLRNIEIDNVIITNSLTISGTLQSPTTNLLSVSSNTINNKLENLSVSSNTINNKLENYYLTNSNSINGLSVSSSNINNKLEFYESLNIDNFNLLGATTLNLDINQNNQTNLQSIENSLLQNQINDLVILGVSENNWNGLFAVSSAIIDSKLGLQLGITNIGLDNRIINLTTTGLNNFNLLGATINLNNQEFQNFKTLTTSNIITLNNLGASHSNRLNELDFNVYDLNTTAILHEIRLDDIDIVQINQNSRLDDLETFNYGTTMSLSSTGINWSETTANTLQDTITYIQYGINGVNVALWARDFYHQTQELGLLGAINAEIAARQGYEVLNDAENLVQDTQIATNSAGLIAAGVLISANTAANVANSVLINGISGVVAGNTNDITTLGVSVNTNIDHKLNSFILGTTTSLATINSTLTNLGTTDNSLSTRISNYENRISIDTLGITFKGQTINSVYINDVGMGISGSLTISGALQSPMTSLLTISSNTTDGRVGKILGVSIPQFLTRNEIILPSTFITSNLNILGTSAFTGSGSIDTNNNYNFYVGGRESFAIKKDTKMAIVACGQDMQSTLYFGTPFNQSNNGNKVSLISQGQSNTSIGKLFFCLNNNTSNHNINAELTDARMSLDANGLLSVSGNQINFNNLTISGTLQSPMTSLLTISSNIIDGKISSQLGITNINLDNKIILLGVSSNIIDGKISSQLGITNINLNNSDILLGVSSNIIDGKVGTIIGVSIPQFLTKNQTTLPSTFTSSSLTNLATLTGLAINGQQTTTTSNGVAIKAIHPSTGNGVWMGMANTTDGQIVANNDIYFYTNGGTQTMRLNAGNQINSNNLTISGTLQSPLTSLLTVSSNIIDGKVGTIIGVSIPNIDARMNSIVSTTGINYLTRNELILPSSFVSSSLTSLGTLTGLAISGNIGITGQFNVYDNNNNSIWMYPFQGDGHINTTNRLRLYSNNGVIGAVLNSGTLTLNNLSITGTQTNSGNLTISGTLQSPMTSLLTVSSNTTDGRVGTIIGVSIPQFLTRNETTLPNTFLNWGTTATSKIINVASNLLINSSDTQNSFMKFRTTGGGGETLLGMLNTIDPFLRLASTSSIYRLQNSTDTANLWTMDNSGNIVNSGNLTISGTLQSPMTSLLTVSSNIIDGKVGKIIGVSIPQFLTRNETILPSSFTTINVNDNLLIKSADANNSYINFTDTTYTGVGTNYIGMIGSNQRLYSQGNIDLYTNSGYNVMSANTNSVSINSPSTISYNLPGNTMNLINTYATFNSTMLGISTAITAGTSAKFISGRANGTETFRVYNNGDVSNTNNSYGAISDKILKENIEPIRDYQEDFMKLEFKKYNLKTNPEEKQIGLIAQDIEKIFPSLITNGEEYKGIKYSILNIIGLSLVQKLIKEVNDLKNEINELKNK